MHKELISIIIPIYNVEKYLTACIKSVMGQTYKEIEILLIDDGSTDGCGKICDEYSLIDPRIKVYHKKNGGLSDARNYGVTKTNGKFIFFLDSDDYMELDTIEKLYINLKKYNADISISNFYYYYGEDNMIENYKITSDLVLNKQEAMQELLKNDFFKNFAWGKLYRKEIIENILFPINTWFEDIYWMHHVIHEIDKIVFINDTLVYYRQRTDSISYNRGLKKIDLIEGYFYRREFLKHNYPDLLQSFDLSLYKVFKEVSISFFFSKNVNNMLEFYRYIKNINMKYREELIQCNKMNKKFLFKIKILLKYPILFNIFFAILKCIKRR